MRALDYAVITRTCFNSVTEAEMEMYKAGMYLEHHAAFVTGYTKKGKEDVASYDGRFGKARQCLRILQLDIAEFVTMWRCNYGGYRFCDISR